MSESAHEIAIRINLQCAERNLNEADTRHKVIDEILHGVLAWPKSQTMQESYISPGYADYRLKKHNGDDLLFLEAKKEGVYFGIPKNFNKNELSKHITVRTLLTDRNIKNAIEQVREYCMEEGCEYAGITNGHEWIFFKIFEKGKNWRDLKALVVLNNTYFSEKFIDATCVLSYHAINDGALKTSLGSISRINREIFYPKDKIPSYNQEVNSNKFARQLRPIAKKYFGVINVSEHDFMHSCYVNQRDYDQAFTNFRSIIKDSLTPYLDEHGIQDLDDNEKGGKFGNRIAKSIREKKEGDVIVLFGGKGAGKSTFLRKLLFHEPPQFLSKYTRVAISDLLNTPEEEESIYEKIWDQIIESLDVDEILKSDRERLLKLFEDKYEISLKQVLCGYDISSELFNVKLNELVKEWLSDKKYVAKRLVNYWKSMHKGCVVAIDNTDQYSPKLQDFCFTTAQEISEYLGCLVIISMREERFHASRIHGTLDAYQNSGFHISSPVTQLVFRKRVEYVLSILTNEDSVLEIFGDDIPKEKIRGCIKLFKIFKNEFRSHNNSPLNEFLTACAHGNIRLALELFRGFLTTGYTNVDEMISVDGLWTLKIHQVLKPVMIPYRFFYDESQSSIPNVFQVRSTVNGSHFTGLRILHKLSDGIDPSNPFYISIGELKDYFSENFNMIDDFEKNIDLFLTRDLVESNNRIDYYCDDVDTVKITTYGLYIYEVLSSYFTYIELVSSDCGIFDESAANDIVSLSINDHQLFRSRKRLERVDARLKKAETFIKYLIAEEKSELDFYGVSQDFLFSEKIMESFLSEKEGVLRSASRNRG